jgi:hypothetical protein
VGPVAGTPDVIGKRVATTWADGVIDRLDKFDPTRQRIEALKLIQPAADKRKECESEVQRAVYLVRAGIELQKRTPSPANYSRRFRKFVKSLKKVEDAGRNLVSDTFMEQVRRYREEYEVLIERSIPRKGSRRLSTARMEAADISYSLLLNFSRSRPSLTAGGLWHRLAAVLFGDANVDLFNFDYLKRVRQIRKLHGQPWRQVVMTAFEEQTSFDSNLPF